MEEDIKILKELMLNRCEQLEKRCEQLKKEKEELIEKNTMLAKEYSEVLDELFALKDYEVK